MNLSKSEREIAVSLKVLELEHGLLLLVNGLARLVAASSVKPGKTTGIYADVWRAMRELDRGLLAAEAEATT